MAHADHLPEQTGATASGSTSHLEGILTPVPRVHVRLESFEVPGRARQAVSWGCFPSPAGPMLLAMQGDAVCALSFPARGEDPRALLRAVWPGCELAGASGICRELAAGLVAAGGDEVAEVTVRSRGTGFQHEVWSALLDIPAGEVWTYGDLARYVGRPKAARAVGQAVGANPVAWLVPCHRVVSSGGGIGGYRWGVCCKRALLELEGVHPDPESGRWT